MSSGKRYLWHNKTTGKWYVRVKGRCTIIKGQPGTREFDQSYWEILSGKRAAAKTSWSALIKSYRGSDRFLNLKPRTRQDYDRVLSYLAEKIGPKDIRQMRRVHVIAAQGANRDRVRFANYIPQVMSVLFEHAKDIGWTDENPARGVRAIRTPKEKRQEHIPWPDAAVAKFRAAAAPLPLLIFEIGVGSVQRPGDWPKFTWGDYDGDELRVTQGKTGAALRLPCTDHLKTTLARALADLGASPLPSRHILTKADGSELPYRRMAEIMRRERKRLGLAAYDLHALRYRGVQELAWAGCSDDEIASYSGHTSKAMVVKYAGTARQIMNARKAREKRK